MCLADIACRNLVSVSIVRIACIRGRELAFFFQAEDGIRYRDVTGFRRVLFRSGCMPLSA